MITVEMDLDETLITIMDSEGNYEDVQVALYDDICEIRQFDPEMGYYETISMSPEMYLKMMKAWELPTGTYVYE